MKNFTVNKRNLATRLAIATVVFCGLVAAPLFSRASAPENSINVTNNSGRTITHVYLASPQREDWSADQLNDSLLPSGQSFTIINVSCSGSDTKVIAEDADGCFVTAVVSCDQNAGWTISSDLVPDCGQ
jgi:hypothetical protein